MADSKPTIKETIINVVERHSGIKATELVLNVMTVVDLDEFCHEEYQKIVYSLVEEGLIEEVEYILPSMDYRIKSIYFPKSTKILCRQFT